MFSVCVRAEGGASIKCSVVAWCETSHSQVLVPGNVRPFFQIFFNGPDPSTVKLSGGGRHKLIPL